MFALRVSGGQAKALYGVQRGVGGGSAASLQESMQGKMSNEGTASQATEKTDRGEAFVLRDGEAKGEAELMPLELQPITYEEACEFIRRHHRHHLPPQGWKFGVAVNDGEKVVGVAVVGRPVARMSDDGWTMELTRLCVDGTKNAASKLLGAVQRATFALGYKRLITYTLAGEGGASLRAGGWKLIGCAGGGSWSRESRPRIDKAPTEQKLLWEAPN